MYFCTCAHTISPSISNGVDADSAAAAWDDSHLVWGPAFWLVWLALTSHHVLAEHETEMLEKWRGVLSRTMLCLGIDNHSLRVNPVDFHEEKALRHLGFVLLVHI